MVGSLHFVASCTEPGHLNAQTNTDELISYSLSSRKAVLLTLFTLTFPSGIFDLGFQVHTPDLRMHRCFSCDFTDEGP
ncbi:hypothetical protein IRJ41_019475 [Triplophysa rosa]|uniref:Uncharacterized protein n=1 Tax=Triplophysa rosa TaxID=992332 RepID=A0A9W7TJ01_TRIRA|nr:hypothetical protein IRJ41_019475 [Triplophysa rosa]